MFLQTTLLIPAQASSPAVPREGLRITEPIDMSSIVLPSEIGRIDEVYGGPSDLKVIIVQDAHAIPDAQRSIRKAILYFYQKYGVSLVALEGTASRLDARMLKSFPDRDRLNKVLGEYFDQGELTGGTAAAISGIKTEDHSAAGTRMIFQGVEDWPVYEEALRLYLGAMGQEEAILEELEVRSSKLEDEKKTVYSPELRKIDTVIKAFRENTSDFMKTLEVLASVKTPEKGSELAVLLQEAKNEGGEQTGAEAEVRKIAETIRGISRQSSAVSETQKELEQKYQEFQTGQLSAKAFALFLNDLLSENPKLLSQFSFYDPRAALTRLSGNQKRLRDIEGTRLFSDFERYSQSVKESLFQSEQDRELDRRDRRLWLAFKLAKLEVSYEEWVELEQMRSEGSWAVDGLKMNLMETLFQPHFDFYRNAQKRDEIFFKNLHGHLKTIKTAGNAAVMVAGGFHAHGLCSLLKANGISYALVMPEIKNLPEESRYREQMRGDFSWKNYFKDENGKVNLYSAFIRGTRDRLLEVEGLSASNPGIPQDPRLLKNWRDQIIRDLADEGRIEKAGDYTRFIDEIIGAEKNNAIQERLARVDQFLEGLKRLDTEGRFTAANISKLFQPATAQTLAVADLDPNAWVSRSLLPASFGADVILPGTAKSEVRSVGADEKPAVSDVPVLSNAQGHTRLRDPKPTALKRPDGRLRVLGDARDPREVRSFYVDAVQMNNFREEVIGDLPVSVYGFDAQDKSMLTDADGVILEALDLLDASARNRLVRKLRTRQATLKSKDVEPLLVTRLEQSESLFEDHSNSGIIGIHRSVFDTPLPAEVKRALLVMGLRHELAHEAGAVLTGDTYEAFEAAQIREDALYLYRKGIRAEQLRDTQLFSPEAELLNQVAFYEVLETKGIPIVERETGVVLEQGVLDSLKNASRQSRMQYTADVLEILSNEGDLRKVKSKIGLLSKKMVHKDAAAKARFDEKTKQNGPLEGILNGLAEGLGDRRAISQMDRAYGTEAVLSLLEAIQKSAKGPSGEEGRIESWGDLSTAVNQALGKLIGEDNAKLGQTDLSMAPAALAVLLDFSSAESELRRNMGTIAGKTTYGGIKAGLDLRASIVAKAQNLNGRQRLVFSEQEIQDAQARVKTFLREQPSDYFRQPGLTLAEKASRLRGLALDLFILRYSQIEKPSSETSLNAKAIVLMIDKMTHVNTDLDNVTSYYEFGDVYLNRPEVDLTGLIGVIAHETGHNLLAAARLTTATADHFAIHELVSDIEAFAMLETLEIGSTQDMRKMLSYSEMMDESERGIDEEHVKGRAVLQDFLNRIEAVEKQTGRDLSISWRALRDDIYRRLEASESLGVSQSRFDAKKFLGDFSETALQFVLSQQGPAGRSEVRGTPAGLENMAKLWYRGAAWGEIDKIFFREETNQRGKLLAYDGMLSPDAEVSQKYARVRGGVLLVFDFSDSPAEAFEHFGQTGIEMSDPGVKVDKREAENAKDLDLSRLTPASKQAILKYYADQKDAAKLAVVAEGLGLDMTQARSLLRAAWFADIFKLDASSYASLAFVEGILLIASLDGAHVSPWLLALPPLVVFGLRGMIEFSRAWSQDRGAAARSETRVQGDSSLPLLTESSLLTSGDISKLSREQLGQAGLLQPVKINRWRFDSDDIPALWKKNVSDKEWLARSALFVTGNSKGQNLEAARTVLSQAFTDERDVTYPKVYMARALAGLSGGVTFLFLVLSGTLLGLAFREVGLILPALVLGMLALGSGIAAYHFFQSSGRLVAEALPRGVFSREELDSSPLQEQIWAAVNRRYSLTRQVLQRLKSPLADYLAFSVSEALTNDYNLQVPAAQRPNYEAGKLLAQKIVGPKLTSAELEGLRGDLQLRMSAKDKLGQQAADFFIAGLLRELRSRAGNGQKRSDALLRFLVQAKSKSAALDGFVTRGLNAINADPRGETSAKAQNEAKIKAEFGTVFKNYAGYERPAWDIRYENQNEKGPYGTHQLDRIDTRDRERAVYLDDNGVPVTARDLFQRDQAELMALADKFGFRDVSELIEVMRQRLTELLAEAAPLSTGQTVDQGAFTVHMSRYPTKKSLDVSLYQTRGDRQYLRINQAFINESLRHGFFYKFLRLKPDGKVNHDFAENATQQEQHYPTSPKDLWDRSLLEQHYKRLQDEIRSKAAASKKEARSEVRAKTKPGLLAGAINLYRDLREGFGLEARIKESLRYKLYGDEQRNQAAKSLTRVWRQSPRDRRFLIESPEFLDAFIDRFRSELGGFWDETPEDFLAGVERYLRAVLSEDFSLEDVRGYLDSNTMGRYLSLSKYQRADEMASFFSDQAVILRAFPDAGVREKALRLAANDFSKAAEYISDLKRLSQDSALAPETAELIAANELLLRLYTNPDYSEEAIGFAQDLLETPRVKQKELLLSRAFEPVESYIGVRGREDLEILRALQGMSGSNVDDISQPVVADVFRALSRPQQVEFLKMFQLLGGAERTHLLAVLTKVSPKAGARYLSLVLENHTSERRSLLSSDFVFLTNLLGEEALQGLLWSKGKLAVHPAMGRFVGVLSGEAEAGSSQDRLKRIMQSLKDRRAAVDLMQAWLSEQSGSGRRKLRKEFLLLEDAGILNVLEFFIQAGAPDELFESYLDLITKSKDIIGLGNILPVWRSLDLMTQIFGFGDRNASLVLNNIGNILDRDSKGLNEESLKQTLTRTRAWIMAAKEPRTADRLIYSILQVSQDDPAFERWGEREKALLQILDFMPDGMGEEFVNAVFGITMNIKPYVLDPDFMRFVAENLKGHGALFVKGLLSYGTPESNYELSGAEREADHQNRIILWKENFVRNFQSAEGQKLMAAVSDHGQRYYLVNLDSNPVEGRFLSENAAFAAMGSPQFSQIAAVIDEVRAAVQDSQHPIFPLRAHFESRFFMDLLFKNPAAARRMLSLGSEMERFYATAKKVNFFETAYEMVSSETAHPTAAFESFLNQLFSPELVQRYVSAQVPVDIMYWHQQLQKTYKDSTASVLETVMTKLKALDASKVLDLFTYFKEAARSEFEVETFIGYAQDLGLHKSIYLFRLYDAMTKNDFGGIVAEAGIRVTASEPAKKIKEALSQIKKMRQELNTYLVQKDALPPGILTNPLQLDLLRQITNFDGSKWARGHDFKMLVQQFLEDRANGLTAPLGEAFTEKDDETGDVRPRMGTIRARKLAKFKFGIDDEKMFAQVRAEIEQALRFFAMGDTAQRNETIRNLALKLTANEQEQINQDREKNQDNPKAMIGVNQRQKRLDPLIAALQQENLTFSALISILGQQDPKANLKTIAPLLRSLLFTAGFEVKTSGAEQAREKLSQSAEISSEAIAAFLEFTGNIIKQHVLTESPGHREGPFSFNEETNKRLSKYLNFSILHTALKQAQAAKEEARVGLTVMPTRGILGELSGYFADACWTQQTNIMRDNPQMTAFVFLENADDPENVNIVGASLLLANTIEGRPAHVIRGFNPQDGVVNRLSAGDLLESFVDYLREIPKMKEDVLLLPGSRSGAASNRPQVIDAISEMQKITILNEDGSVTLQAADALPLETPEKFNGYDITNNVYAVPSRSEMRTEDSQSAAVTFAVNSRVTRLWYETDEQGARKLKAEIDGVPKDLEELSTGATAKIFRSGDLILKISNGSDYSQKSLEKEALFAAAIQSRSGPEGLADVVRVLAHGTVSAATRSGALKAPYVLLIQDFPSAVTFKERYRAEPSAADMTDRLAALGRYTETVERIFNLGAAPGDLKANNLLVDEAGRTQLIDLGSSFYTDAAADAEARLSLSDFEFGRSSGYFPTTQQIKALMARYEKNEFTREEFLRALAVFELYKVLIRDVFNDGSKAGLLRDMVFKGENMAVKVSELFGGNAAAATDVLERLGVLAMGLEPRGNAKVLADFGLLLKELAALLPAGHGAAIATEAETWGEQASLDTIVPPEAEEAVKADFTLTSRVKAALQSFLTHRDVTALNLLAHGVDQELKRLSAAYEATDVPEVKSVLRLSVTTPFAALSVRRLYDQRAYQRELGTGGKNYENFLQALKTYFEVPVLQQEIDGLTVEVLLPALIRLSPEKPELLIEDINALSLNSDDTIAPDDKRQEVKNIIEKRGVSVEQLNRIRTALNEKLYEAGQKPPEGRSEMRAVTFPAEVYQEIADRARKLHELVESQSSVPLGEVGSGGRQDILDALRQVQRLSENKADAQQIAPFAVKANRLYPGADLKNFFLPDQVGLKKTLASFSRFVLAQQRKWGAAARSEIREAIKDLVQNPESLEAWQRAAALGKETLAIQYSRQEIDTILVAFDSMDFPAVDAGLNPQSGKSARPEEIQKNEKLFREIINQSLTQPGGEGLGAMEDWAQAILSQTTAEDQAAVTLEGALNMESLAKRMPEVTRLLRDSSKAKALAEILTLFRSAIPAEKSNRNDFELHLGTNVYLRLDTGSFRRFVLLEKNPAGEVQGGVEIKLPGEQYSRRVLHPEDHTLAETFNQIPELQGLVQKGLAVFQYAEGDYRLYGQTVTYTGQAPFRIIVSEYQPQRKRLSDFISEKAASMKPAEASEIERQVTELFLDVTFNGWIVDFGIVFHLQNLWIEETSDGVKVGLVNDLYGFRDVKDLTGEGRGTAADQAVRINYALERSAQALLVYLAAALKPVQGSNAGNSFLEGLQRLYPGLVERTVLRSGDVPNLFLGFNPNLNVYRRSELRLSAAEAETTAVLEKPAEHLGQFVVSGELPAEMIQEISEAVEEARRQKGASVEVIATVIRDKVLDYVNRFKEGASAIESQSMEELVSRLGRVLANVFQTRTEGGVTVAVALNDQDGVDRLAALVRGIAQLGQEGALEQVVFSGGREARNRVMQEVQRQNLDGVRVAAIPELNRGLEAYLTSQLVLPAVHGEQVLGPASNSVLGLGLRADLKTKLTPADRALLQIAQTFVQLTAAALLAEEVDSAAQLVRPETLKASLLEKMLGAEALKLETAQGLIQIDENGRLEVSQQGVLGLLQVITSEIKARAEVRKAA